MALLSVPVKRVPCQWFDFTYGDVKWDIRLASVSGRMIMDVALNGNLVAAGILCQYGVPLLKKAGVSGDLIFLSNQDTAVTSQNFCEGTVSLYFAESSTDIPS